LSRSRLVWSSWLAWFNTSCNLAIGRFEKLFESEWAFEFHSEKRVLIEADLAAAREEHSGNGAAGDDSRAGDRSTGGESAILGAREQDDRRASHAEGGAHPDIAERSAAIAPSLERSLAVGRDLLIPREVGDRLDDDRDPSIASIDPDMVKINVELTALEWFFWPGRRRSPCRRTPCPGEAAPSHRR